MTISAVRHMLVSDLQGALLGHEDALEGFRQWSARERGPMILAYYLKRGIPNPRETLSQLNLPAPDFLIGGHGAEIFDFAQDNWIPEWERKDEDGWNADKVRRILRSLTGFKIQPKSIESTRIISAQLTQNIDKRLREIEMALEREGLAARLRIVGEQLYIWPEGVNQLSAVEFLARQSKIPDAQVIVCGGEESDPSIFLGAFSGVLVANSSSFVPPTLAGTVYRSPFKYADGIIDGVQYWRDRWNPPVKFFHRQA